MPAGKRRQNKKGVWQQLVTIKGELRRRAIRMCLGEVYFFNDSGIYEKRTVTAARAYGVRDIEYQDRITKEARRAMPWYELVCGCSNDKIIGEAVRKLEIGNSIEDLIMNIENVKEDWYGSKG